jgi:hypothetical protein
MHEKVYETWFDRIGELVTVKVLENKLAADEVACMDLFPKSFPGGNAPDFKVFCKDSPAGSLSDTLVRKLVNFCYWETQDTFQAAGGLKELGITWQQAVKICGIKTPSKKLPADKANWAWVDYEIKANLDIAVHYSCEAVTHCPRRELLARQWTTSEVTNNVMPEIGLKRTDSIVDWIPDTPISHFRFEFSAFATKWGVTTLPSSWTIPDSLQLISYDRLISPLSLGRAIALWMKDGDHSWSRDRFFFPDTAVLDGYTKYAILEGFFEGLTTKKTVQELLFGFKSAPLCELRDKNPMQGGDPTTDCNPTFIKNHEKFVETRHTGRANSTLAGQFYKMNGLPYINYKKSQWNGTEVYDEWINPWGEEIPFDGGDAMFGPWVEDRQIPVVYQQDFFRTFRFKYLSDDDTVSGKDLIR